MNEKQQTTTNEPHQRNQAITQHTRGRMRTIRNAKGGNSFEAWCGVRVHLSVLPLGVRSECCHSTHTTRSLEMRCTQPHPCIGMRHQFHRLSPPSCRCRAVPCRAPTLAYESHSYTANTRVYVDLRATHLNRTIHTHTTCRRVMMAASSATGMTQREAAPTHFPLWTST